MAAENFELEILLKTRAQLSDLIKTKQSLKDVADETKKVGATSKDTEAQFGNSLKGVQGGLRDVISPITMLRRTWFQVGIAWALTGGTIIAAINDISNKIKELNDLSIKYGKSTEELSKEIYGYNIATEQAKIATYGLAIAQQSLGKGADQAKSKVVESTGEMIIFYTRYREIIDKLTKNPFAPFDPGFLKNLPPSLSSKEATEKITKAGEEAIRSDIRNVAIRNNLEKQAQDALKGTFQLKKESIEKEAGILKEARANEEEITNFKLLSLERLSRDRDRILNSMQNSTLKAQGNEREAFLNNIAFETQAFRDEWGDDGRMMEIRRNFTDASIAEFNRSRLGLITNLQAMEGFTKQSVNAMKSSFTSFFSDVFSGQLKTAKEYFMAFLQDIMNAWSRAMAEMVVSNILMPDSKKSKSSGILGVLGAVSSVAGLFGGGGAAVAGKGNVAGMLQGQGKTLLPKGYADGGWAGLNGPEVSVVGEREPEFITPLSMMNSGGGSGTKNVYYFIQAVDARSFSDIVASNPDAIVAVTEDAIRRNKSIRKTIRNLT